MKTKELIEALQEADPTGELDVCIQHDMGCDYIGVWRVERYHDARFKPDEEESAK